MRLIYALELKRSIACSSILEDGKTLEQIIDEQPTIEPEQRWIPCSERLPEKYVGEWLCCDKYGNCYILEYDTPGDGRWDCAFYYTDDDGWPITVDVVAWMPLPSPYEVSQA